MGFAYAENSESPNDMCYVFNEYHKIFYFEDENMISDLELDKRYDAKKKNFEYTFGLWIKDDNSSYSTDIYSQLTASYIIKLGGVFTLYYDSDTTASVYISANNADKGFAIDSFTVPDGQWINI
jgi:hypothetical protein